MSNIFDRMAAKNGDPANAKSQDGDGRNEGDPSSEHEVGGHERSEQSSMSATSREIKEVAQELIKRGYIEESRKQTLFRRAMVHENGLTAVLEPLDLEMRLDTHRGVAFLAVAATSCEASEVEDDRSTQALRAEQAWSHPLVRRQRMTLEQSLLVAILRQAFVIHEQDSGVGQADAKIAVDDLLPQFLTYFEDSGSDAKNESRLLNLLDQLKAYGIVSEVDRKQEVIIRPLIAHMANPAALSALLDSLREQVDDS